MLEQLYWVPEVIEPRSAPVPISQPAGALPWAPARLIIGNLSLASTELVVCPQ